MQIKHISILNFLIALWQVAFHFSASVIANKDFCKNPIPPNTPLDVKWADEHAKDGWNVQFGHPKVRDMFARLMNGENEGSPDWDHTDMCLRINFNFAGGVFNGFFSGNGDKKSTFDCTEGIKCTYKSHDKLYNETVTAHVSFFDDKKDHNLISVVFCFANGDVGWSAFSRSKTISKEELSTLNDHYKAIGFNTELGVPYHHKEC